LVGDHGFDDRGEHTFAERWIGTLRRELLDRTIIWNQHQLERLVVDGTVALTDRLARPTVDTPVVRSDRGDEFIESCRHT
jgi:hypothetical protein